MLVFRKKETNTIFCNLLLPFPIVYYNFFWGGLSYFSSSSSSLFTFKSRQLSVAKMDFLSSIKSTRPFLYCMSYGSRLSYNTEAIYAFYFSLIIYNANNCDILAHFQSWRIFLKFALSSRFLYIFLFYLFVYLYIYVFTDLFVFLCYSFSFLFYFIYLFIYFCSNDCGFRGLCSFNDNFTKENPISQSFIMFTT